MNSPRRRSIEVDRRLARRGTDPDGRARRQYAVLVGHPGHRSVYRASWRRMQPSQARFAFDHMRALLAGRRRHRCDDVVRMTVYLKDNAAREHVNAEWLKCFPDPHDRPARHTLIYDLQGGMLLQLEVIAIVNDL